MIENDLNTSVELREVSKPRDSEEFEGVTNRDFNKSFELAMMAADRGSKPLFVASRFDRKN